MIAYLLTMLILIFSDTGYAGENNAPTATADSTLASFPNESTPAYCCIFTRRGMCLKKLKKQEIPLPLSVVTTLIQPRENFSSGAIIFHAKQDAPDKIEKGFEAYLKSWEDFYKQQDAIPQDDE